MVNVQPEVLADIIMWNGLDKTRDEIATRINTSHETDLSSRDVGEAINAVESEADQGDARAVYYRVHGRGLGVGMGEEIAAALSIPE